MLNKDNEFESWECRGWSKIKNLVDCMDMRIMSMRRRFQQISAVLTFSRVQPCCENASAFDWSTNHSRLHSQPLYFLSTPDMQTRRNR